MFNKIFKLIIAFLILCIAIWQFTENNIGNGIMYIFISLIFVFFYFRNEFILLAFLKLRKQDFEGAKKWLSKIKNPSNALTKKQEGYYNYLHGIMVSQSNMNDAERYFKKQLIWDFYGSRPGHGKIKLSRNCFSKRRPQEAKIFSVKLKSLIKEIC